MSANGERPNDSPGRGPGPRQDTAPNGVDPAELPENAPNSSHDRGSEGFDSTGVPGDVYEASGNEVDVVDVGYTEESRDTDQDVALAASSSGVRVYEYTYEVGKRKVGFELRISHPTDPWCNYSATLHWSHFSLTGSRVDCDASNSISGDLGLVYGNLTVEPLRGGSVAEDGFVVNGELCGRGLRGNKCKSVHTVWDF